MASRFDNWKTDWKKPADLQAVQEKIRVEADKLRTSRANNDAVLQNVQKSTPQEMQALVRNKASSLVLNQAASSEKSSLLPPRLQSQLPRSDSHVRDARASAGERFNDAKNAAVNLQRTLDGTSSVKDVGAATAQSQPATLPQPKAFAAAVPLQTPTQPLGAKIDKAKDAPKDARSPKDGGESKDAKAAQLKSVENAQKDALQKDAQTVAIAAQAGATKGYVRGDAKGDAPKTDKAEAKKSKDKDSDPNVEGKATAKHLSRMLDGRGFDANADAANSGDGGAATWQASSSDAVSRDPDRVALTDKQPLISYTPDKSDELRNLSHTLSSDVIKDARLKEIADLAKKADVKLVRLAEKALSQKIVDTDPEVAKALATYITLKRSEPSYGFGIKG